MSENLPLAPASVWSNEDLAIIRDSYARDCTPAQFKLYLAVCKHSGLNPLAGQIHAVVYKGHMVPQTSIDGYRTIAERTGLHGGITARRLLVRDRDGNKLDVPHSEYDPKEHTEIISATVCIRRKDRDQPECATALWQSFAKKQDGKLAQFWAQMPDVMLLKCAEAAAIRSVFPQVTHGIYTAEEMTQAGPPDAAINIEVVNVKPSPPTAKTEAPPPAQAEPTPNPTPKRKAKTTNIADTYSAIFGYYDKLGYQSDALSRIKALILERFDVQDPEEIPETENDQLSEFGRHIKETLKAEGFIPQQGA